jgi:hypothetical protein
MLDIYRVVGVYGMMGIMKALDYTEGAFAGLHSVIQGKGYRHHIRESQSRRVTEGCSRQ